MQRSGRMKPVAVRVVSSCGWKRENARRQRTRRRQREYRQAWTAEPASSPVPHARSGPDRSWRFTMIPAVSINFSRGTRGCAEPRLPKQSRLQPAGGGRGDRSGIPDFVSNSRRSSLTNIRPHDASRQAAEATRLGHWSGTLRSVDSPETHNRKSKTLATASRVCDTTC